MRPPSPCLPHYSFSLPVSGTKWFHSRAALQTRSSAALRSHSWTAWIAAQANHIWWDFLIYLSGIQQLPRHSAGERISGAAAGVKPDCTDSSGAAREDRQVRVLSALQQNKHQKHEVFLLFAVPQGTYFYTSELSPTRICQNQGCLQHRGKQAYQQLKMAL